MVFFMNEGDIPSPVLGQRSACSATQAGPERPGPGRSRRHAPPQPQVGLHQRLPVSLHLTTAAGRRARPEEGPADAHHRRSGRHGRLEVVAHPHGALLEPQTVGQAPQRCEGLLGRALARRRHRHQAPHLESQLAQPSHELAGRGRASSRCGRPDRSSRPAPEPVPRARSGRSARPRPRGPRSATAPPAAPAAPPCSAAPHRENARPPRGRRCRRPPCPPTPPRSSRPGPSNPPGAPRDTACGPNPLVTPTTRTREGSPPARSIRRRMASSLSATSSLAEEGGDVEIVVSQVELVVRPCGIGEDVHWLRRGEDRRRQVTRLGGGPCPLPSARIRRRSP